ncbi:MAG: hemerythrin domain-containing protein [Myxococcales bacterium]|nr:hemerythrin domain-containing protein [Myxococcales bacterium]
MKRHPSLVALSRDHHHALVMAQSLKLDAPARLTASLPASATERVALLTAWFARELEPHFMLEERVLPGHADPTLVGRVLADHARLRDTLATLATATDLPLALDAWARDLEDHIHFEERSWFPSIEQTLAEDELDHLGVELRSWSHFRLNELRERAKELACLYEINAALLDRSQPPHRVFMDVIRAIPAGWQRPTTVHARIEYLGRQHAEADFDDRGARLEMSIRTWGRVVGRLEVVDTAASVDHPEAFLPEEQVLLGTIAGRLGDYLEWKQQELGSEPIGAAAEQWRWRQGFVERLATVCDRERFGVEAIYLTGSTERGDAELASDIDLAIHFTGSEEQRRDLKLWLEGWSQCLAEVAYRHAGHLAADGLLDIRWLSAPPPARTMIHYRRLA